MAESARGCPGYHDEHIAGGGRSGLGLSSNRRRPAYLILVPPLSAARIDAGARECYRGAGGALPPRTVCLKAARHSEQQDRLSYLLVRRLWHCAGHMLSKGMVGASGFEPPASWSRTKNPRTFNDLARLPTIAYSCAKFLFFKDFQAFPKRALATARNSSMRGVGTKMGTVLSRDSRA